MLTPQEFEQITEEIYRFHTKRAPGIPIGVAMVDYARDVLGPVPGKINAVAETQACLSDVLQVMMGCTIGNRYLRVLPDLGRYALTLFDRDSGLGVRVAVDPHLIDPDKTPELHRFFYRQRDPEVQKGGTAREESGRIIIGEFQKVGRAILVAQRVKVLRFGKPPMLPAAECGGCGETFLQGSAAQSSCLACAGKHAYYQVDQPVGKK
jgi:formylmethanofuran dehydrogenase subunit E